MPERIVVFVTILFALSLITEKTTQFIRDYTIKANYFIVGIVLLLQLSLIYNFYGNRNQIAFLLVFVFLINVLWLFKDYLGWQLIKPKSIKDLRNYTLARVILISFVIIFFLIAPVIYGFIVILELLFVLSLLSLGIIKIGLPLYKRDLITDPTFLTIPNIEQKKFSGLNAKKNNSEINLLAFVIGFFFASFFDVNVFDLDNFLNSSIEVNQVFFDFENTTLKKVNSDAVRAFLSYVLVGFFLSFGSKFFHDLLDLVYSVKRTKQAIKDERLFKLQNANQVLSFLENYQIRYHLENKRSELHQIGEIIGTGIVLEQINGKYIEHILVTSLDESIDISEYFQVANKKGDLIEVPFVVRKVENFAELLYSPKLDWNETIKNKSNLAQFGSFSVIVSNNNEDKYLLTCYHVVKHSNHNFRSFHKTDNNRIVEQGNKRIGIISHGVIDKFIDAALIKLDSNIDLSDFQENPIDVSRISDRIENGLSIILYAQKSKNLVYGQVNTVNQAYKINYKGYKPPNNDGKYVHELFYLFSINDFPSSGLSELGDSGGCVYRLSDGLPIGMVVAKEKRVNGDTLVIPLKAIFNEFPEIKFIYPLKL